MARMSITRRKKAKRRPKSHNRMDPTAVNSAFMQSDEEQEKDFIRDCSRLQWLALMAGERAANKARRARRPWDKETV